MRRKASSSSNSSSSSSSESEDDGDARKRRRNRRKTERMKVSIFGLSFRSVFVPFNAAFLNEYWLYQSEKLCFVLHCLSFWIFRHTSSRVLKYLHFFNGCSIIDTLSLMRYLLNTKLHLPLFYIRYSLLIFSLFFSHYSLMLTSNGISWLVVSII